MNGTAGAFAVALDMDGVILDSAEAKAQTFLALFADRSPAERRAIDGYNRANLGVPRSAKLRHVAQAILGLDVAIVAAWLQRYAELLAGQPGAPLIPGVADLFADPALHVFVCSSAPLDEVRAHLAHHGLDRLARGIHGFPVAKADALARIAPSYGPRLCFVGDAAADRPETALPGEAVIADLRGYRDWAFG